MDNQEGRIVETAVETGSALVCGRMLRPSGIYVHPVSGAIRRLAMMIFYVLTIVRLAQIPVWQGRLAPLAAAGDHTSTRKALRSSIEYRK